MKDIDHLIGKIKRMICSVLGHRLEAYFKVINGDDCGIEYIEIKYYKCTRCGKKITVNEYKRNGYKAINIKIIK